jgi:ATP dependent DNA ligase C terminal region
VGFAGARCGDQPQTKQRERADVGAVLDRQTLCLRLPHKLRFLPFDVEQIALCLGLAPLPLLMAQAGGVIGFGVNLALDGNKWDGIYLGRRKGKDLIYAGKVDHGFDKTSAADLRKRLTPLIRKTQPYTKRIAHKGIWVEPELLAEIEYRAKSAEGKVRHPFFKGLREDL